tara:strand:+ start:79 stop:1203 length:1125 start_codon:yes stop_codon:yes gene_type:complete
MIYQTKSFIPGEYIVREGELGNGFYILDEGELEVTRNEKVLNEITLQGAMFGELSDLLNHKRDASIRAKTSAVVKFFDMGLQEFVVKNPKFAVKIIRNLGRRLCWMNEMAIRGNTRNDYLRSVEPIAEDGNLELVPRLLVVDDKKMIFDQLKDCIADTGWEALGALEAEEALDICESESFSAIVISCSLPDDSAIDLRRKLKTNPLSSRTPVVGMLVKIDDSALKTAADAGFSHFIYKPIVKNAALTTLYQVLELDPSDQYFQVVKGSLLFSVPAELTASLVDEIKSSFRARIRDTINDGVDKVIVDVSKLEEVGEDSVELVGDFAEEIEGMGNPFDIAFISQGEDSDMWKNLDGCEEAEVFDTLEDAVSGQSE